MNQLHELFNDSLIKTVTQFLDESAFLNESVELIIQWFIHKDSH